MPLRWSIAHSVHIAMSLRAEGDLRDDAARQAWCQANAIPMPTVPCQVHGSTVAILPVPEPCTADGLVASADEAIAVFGCDCPPLAIATPQGYGVAHCGWRGTAAGVIGNLIDALAERTPAPCSTWAALVGPGVHPDDFEVDGPVLAARTWPPGTVQAGRPGHAWLDLPAAIAADCRAAGISQVARSPLATSRDHRLRSHRRDGPGFPQMLVAWRAPCAG